MILILDQKFNFEIEFILVKRLNKYKVSYHTQYNSI